MTEPTPPEPSPETIPSQPESPLPDSYEGLVR